MIPLFQRPYVWDLEDQWEPLWGDVRRIADLRLSEPATSATHFLGAVVLQAMDNQWGTLQPRSIIDGQQRLTTLQLFIDATAAVFEAHGFEDLAAQLEGLAHNATHFVVDGDTLKLRHSNRDAEPFREVMEADPPVEYEKLAHARSLLVMAHEYFSGEVVGWLGEDDTGLKQRAIALTTVLTNGLQLVVIDLKKDENSQEIFETLNARGTPLTAADLIKNLVFQRLSAEGVDTKKAYAELWQFDTPFWEKTVSAGRYPISRGSLFLNQWLISRLGEEIGPKSTFTRFKHYVEHEAKTSMSSLLLVIRDQAELYRHWTERAADPHADLSTVELCVYRMQAAESELLKPVLIWLHQPGLDLAQGTIDQVVGITESWLLRRALIRLSLSDLGRVVADLIKTHRTLDSADLGSRIEDFLRRQTASSTYWPGDEELRNTLASEQAYRRFKTRPLAHVPRSRRGPLARVHRHQPVDDRNAGSAYRLSDRTILPQHWRTNWPVDDLQAEIDRDNHVHRLGNLTLLTTSLNSAVSNGPWQGPGGKRAKLDSHDVFLLNRRVRDLGADGWDETRIDHRTDELVQAFVATWPVPEGHLGIHDQVPSATDSSTVTVRALLAAGLLTPGTKLVARPGPWGAKECEVLEDGDLMLDDQRFTSVSAAGHHLRQAGTNGWWFWSLPDGRRLKDLRADYLASMLFSREAGELIIEPFTPAELADPLKRLDDLVAIAGRLTVMLSPRDRRLAPSGSNDPDFRWRRYVPAGSRGTDVAIGVRAGDRGQGTPLWMRVHRDTPHYELATYGLREQLPAVELDPDGHTWLPLEIPVEVGNKALLDRLREQAAQYIELIADSTSSAEATN